MGARLGRKNYISAGRRTQRGNSRIRGIKATLKVFRLKPSISSFGGGWASCWEKEDSHRHPRLHEHKMAAGRVRLYTCTRSFLACQACLVSPSLICIQTFRVCIYSTKLYSDRPVGRMHESCVRKPTRKASTRDRSMHQAYVQHASMVRPMVRGCVCMRGG
jgi:hypothetical protein